MRLKRVRIFGFKTFAERTDFDVDGPIVAVVGPNGCGKSNIVDAILWALGEGNPKHLRAETGQDVIFNGSSRRRPLGYAEVTLLFDNEDGALPVESSEVSVSRRLNRAGESEYTINRQACRLKDVLELLADSGLGRAGYAIVTQKEIDQALAASPEDRRAWVDEAAGVQRYRARKSESMRRLASAQGHLDRVQDILSEIESQREPLREEAEAARRYKAVLSSLREVESGQLVAEVAQAAREASAQAARQANSTRLAEAEVAQAEALERELHAASVRISDLERALDALRNEQHAALSAFEQAESGLRLIEHQIAAIDEAEVSLGAEAETLHARVNEALRELEQARKEQAEEAERLERVRQDCAGAGEEARSLTEALAAIDAKLADARNRETARLRLEAESAHRRERIRQIGREISGIEESLPQLREAAAEASKSHAEVADALRRAEEALREKRERLAESEKQEVKAAEEHRIALAERARVDGRRKGLAALVEAHEGLQQGSRAVLEAAKSRKLKGKPVPLGEVVEVDPIHTRAIEALLGASVGELFVDDEQQAVAAIGYLRQSGTGRATLLLLSTVATSEKATVPAKVLSEPGVVGRATDFVRCDPRYRPALDRVLASAVVVESLEAAMRVAAMPGCDRAVTPEGEIVESRGAITGGAAPKESGGMLQRAGEVAELDRRLAEVDRTLKAAEKDAGIRARRRELLRSELDADRLALESRRAEVDEAARWLKSIADEIAATERAREKLIQERERCEAETPTVGERIDLAALEAERDAILGKLASRSSDAAQAEQAISDAETRLSAATLRAQQAERRVSSAQEAETARARKLANVKPDRERLGEERLRNEAERNAAAIERERTAKALQQAQEEKRATLERSLALAEQSKKARLSAQAASEEAHRAELARARADARRANALPRLLEEYGIDEAEALAREPTLDLPSDAAALTSRLRRELRAMGEVNLGAVEAYERLTTRADDLSSQSEDIREGIREVEAGIRELDKLTRDRFLETFEKVSTAFEQLFARIFQGGAGAIRLAEPESLLDTGIEIDVTLPGKKRQKLELLSGGERSLCAAAFLFSLLRVKPSPLVVLDEVDAPLDGRNVERFVDLLREFSSESQFIVITHNPTTIAAAPVWLGVTMQEPGVSTLVPARLAPREAVGVVAETIGVN